MDPTRGRHDGCDRGDREVAGRRGTGGRPVREGDLRRAPPARLVRAVVVAGLLALAASGVPAQTSELDNGVIRVAVDLSCGGAISELGESGSSLSVVNVRDLGRYVQQSYYSGPQPYVPPGAEQHPAYAGWGWNPVQAGDVYGHRSRLLESSNDGATLYARSIPQQWALRDVAAACTLETWLTLDENRVHMRCRFAGARADTTRYPARHQELPAVYTVGTLHRLFTYTGTAPFTGDALTQITNSGPPWEYWTATEHWSALVDDTGWGLGVYHAGASLTVGGFHGSPGWGGPTANNTGYLAPLHTDLLDHGIVYEYRCTLILGNLETDIRAWAVAQAAAPGPDFEFDSDRQHWVPAGLDDPAPPFAGFWPLRLDQPDPRIVGPPLLWQAADVPRLHLHAAFLTAETGAALFFAGEDGAFSGQRRVDFEVIPDGVARTYTLDLSAHPLYTGPITRLRLDPIQTATPGDRAQLYFLRAVPPTAAATPPPGDPVGLIETIAPSPFNAATTIGYRLRAPAVAELAVFDAAGRRIRTLVAGEMRPAGRHEVIWDGRDEAGRRAPAGVYLCRLRAAGQASARSLVLVP